MEGKQQEKLSILSDRFQNILGSLTKCKIDLTNEIEESKKIREINAKLEVELKECRELEKSHRYHLSSSREMIGNLQETVSQLVYLKRDMKKLKDEIALKDNAILALEKEKENVFLKHNDDVKELREAHGKQIQQMVAENERKMQQAQHDSDTQLAQFTCVIEELRSKMKDMDTEHRDKMNVVVLEYEEKIQRGAAQVAQLQEQLARQAARTDANIDAYRRRLEELEEKLKQSQFKQYLAHSSYGQYEAPQYESQVERPFSVDRELYDDASVDLDPVLEKPKMAMTNQNKAQRATPMSSLQVMYYGNKTANVPRNTEKKGQFNITKKRKLYSDKEHQDF